MAGRGEWRAGRWDEHTRARPPSLFRRAPRTGNMRAGAEGECSPDLMSSPYHIIPFRHHWLSETNV